MKKLGFQATLFTIALSALTACSNDDNQPEEPTLPVITTGAYILNTGTMNSNQAGIQWYDMESGTVSEDLFKQINGYDLGDTGSDLCIYGSKMYVACTGSAKIEIMNKTNGKVIKTLPLKNAKNEPVKPRFFTAAGGKVYFTAQDGTVSRLDTLSMTITGSIAVGAYPEALTSANGKLYVNLSDYTMAKTGKQVAVVDIASFQKQKDIEVLLNPYDVCITAADGFVYVVSCGDFNGNPLQTLQRIDPVTDQVTEVCRASQIANKGDKMYLIYAEYFLPEDTKTISVYDLKTKQLEKFVDYKSFKNPTMIDVDPVSGDVYIGDVSYNSNSHISIYTSKGVFKKKIEVGYGVTGVFFLTK